MEPVLEIALHQLQHIGCYGLESMLSSLILSCYWKVLQMIQFSFKRSVFSQALFLFSHHCFHDLSKMEDKSIKVLVTKKESHTAAGNCKWQQTLEKVIECPPILALIYQMILNESFHHWNFLQKYEEYLRS